MRQELERRIREAHRRLEGGVPTEDERVEAAQHQAIEDFKVFLAQRIDFITRTELLLGADYFWQETGPAVRFELDGRVFVLAKKEDGTCCLSEKDGESMAVLLADDKQFEDRLLVAVGSMLENGSAAA
jgi:hypothetical protein